MRVCHYCETPRHIRPQCKKLQEDRFKMIKKHLPQNAKKKVCIIEFVETTRGMEISEDMWLKHASLPKLKMSGTSTVVVQDIQPVKG